VKNYRIEIAPYDSSWPEQYEEEKTKLEEAISGFNVVFEHIGSTSIPNTAAKPIIDIAIGIEDLSLADRMVKLIEPLGYRYEPSIEDFMPDYRFMWKGEFLPGPLNVHKIHVGIRALTSDGWKNAITFRDYLRSHHETSGLYAEMKTLLSKQYGDDPGRYNYEKTTFVNTVLSLAQRGL